MLSLAKQFRPNMPPRLKHKQSYPVAFRGALFGTYHPLFRALLQSFNLHIRDKNVSAFPDFRL